MQEPVKIAIVMDGGLIQDVLTAGVPVEFVIVDYDIEGAAPDELRDVPQDTGTTPAYVRQGDAQPAGPFVMRVFELCEHGPVPVDPPLEPFEFRSILERYDDGDINDDKAIAELCRAGWPERRAYTILEQHQNA